MAGMQGAAKACGKETTQAKIVFMAALLMWLSQYVYMPYQTPYLLSIGVASSMVGVVVGAYGLPQLILRFPIGILADRKPRHKVFILIGAASTGVASVFRILLPDATGFLIGSLFSGVASSMWVSFLVVYPAFYGPTEQKKATGFIFAASNLGILMGFAIASLLFEGYGMTALCAVSIASSATAVVLALWMKEPARPRKILPVKELLGVLKDGRLLLFALVVLVQQGVVASAAMSFTAQRARELAASDLQVGLCAVIYMGAAFISAALTGQRHVEKLGARWLVPLIQLGLFAYCMAVPNVGTVYAIFLLQVLAGLSQGMLQSYCVEAAMRRVPVEKKSTAMGMFQSVYAAGIVFMPVMTGSMVQAMGLHAAYGCLGIFAMAAFVGVAVYYGKSARGGA